jgi:hypothetical protein
MRIVGSRQCQAQHHHGWLRQRKRPGKICRREAVSPLRLRAQQAPMNILFNNIK